MLTMGLMAAMGAGCNQDAKGGDIGAQRSSVALAAAPDSPLLDIAADLGDPEQAEDVLYGQVIAAGKPVATVMTGIAQRSTWDPVSFPSDKPLVAPAPPARSKIAAELAAQIAAANASNTGAQKIGVLVRFREKYKMPRFPTLRADLTRDAPENKSALDRAQKIVDRFQAARAPDHAQIGSEIAQLGANARESFWLVNAMSLDIPLAAIETLAARTE